MADPTFVSALPALLVFVLAILTRRPIESLICGALVGLVMLYGSNLFPEFAGAKLRVTASVADADTSPSIHPDSHPSPRRHSTSNRRAHCRVRPPSVRTCPDG